MKKGKIHIGTSGWHYKHWKDTFYPADIKEHEQFNFYSEEFKTVEINNSFYRLPSKEVFSSWRKASPPEFLFAVKASRYITHLKKLKTDNGGFDLFFSHASRLKEKLGPILFQLPPRWKINLQRLKEFLVTLPNKYRYAVEFRDTSWYTPETYDLLKKHNCSFCVYELAGHITPLEITADFVYVRLHGPSINKYQGSYTNPQLKKWARQCRHWQKQGRDVYIYFDNDQEGYAAFNAKSLQKMVRQK